MLYTVADGTSTSCIPNNPSSDLSVTIDAPDTINTCDDVPIQIQGGQRPYHVTIAITNSAAAINITMSAANDYYQWVERADPNQSLIIAVSDRSVNEMAVPSYPSSDVPFSPPPPPSSCAVTANTHLIQRSFPLEARLTRFAQVGKTSNPLSEQAALFHTSPQLLIHRSPPLARAHLPRRIRAREGT